jgi:D-hexose-6-phosphate mutarotase
LTLQLSLTNLSDTQDVSLENCLHTYFLVGDCETIQVRGLGKVEYLDKLEGFARRSPTGAGIRIASEVDRVYVNTADPVEILDPTLKRIIRIEKTGSASTVVWNPWVAKSRQMPDFGDEEFHRMVCVESGNVGENQLPLRPGQTSVVKVTVSSSPLGLG